jgi:hypothetical protein
LLHYLQRIATTQMSQRLLLAVKATTDRSLVTATHNVPTVEQFVEYNFHHMLQ